MKRIPFLLIVFLAVSCGGTKKATVDSTPVTEIRQLDTLVVSDDPQFEELPTAPEEHIPNELPVYQASPRRMIDIHHTALDLSFDWTKKEVLGQALITLSPYFYPIDEIVLDAKNFEIQSVQRKENNQPLEYKYDGEQITIQLEKRRYKGDELTISIDYIARPSRTGGSDAITGDNGLFFINADGTEDKPQQIWTQGETEHNSKWFPTVDKPNERMTTDITLTVDDRFKTLSNGLLIESKQTTDGQRTDHWRMDQPHAPYLVMIAVGDFVKVEDQWKDIPLGYWVEPEYEEDAKYIFDNTPEMLTYFSDLIGTPYPWKKYDQIVVRDYVSGAMENTTAVVFGEFVQRKKRDLIDDNNDRIVAHELFHHWFGDLVTTESWSNLTMNEGFANYSEHLWRAHHYGKYEGQAQLFDEKYGYIYSSQTSGIHPLIYFSYKDKEDMFDAHAYNKGGLVLHMLRHEVGDKAFFAGLKYYLERNEYSAVEAHDLRLAMEHVTGRDLNWFFNQWYFEAGHPELDIEYTYDSTSQSLDILVKQTQDPQSSIPIFQIPATFHIHTPGDTVQQVRFWLNQREQNFTVEGLTNAPTVVNFNPDHVLLAPAEQHFTTEQATYLVNHADHVGVILENLQKANPILINVDRLLDFPAKDIQLIALDMVQPGSSQAIRDKVKEMALHAENSFVREKAILITGQLGQPLDEIKLIAIAQSRELPYRIINAALLSLRASNPQTAIEVLQTIDVRESPTLVPGAASIFAETRDPQHLSFFEENKTFVKGQSAIPFYSSYLSLLAVLEPGKMMESIAGLMSEGRESGDLFQKYGLVKGVADLIRSEEIEVNQAQVLKEEVNPVIQSVDNPNYRRFFQSMLDAAQ
ncbi:M1 family metallopeptidase [Membranicola marinus]|uniref:Aminopeptidase N n=1 Tax=Membranihabitans marinus TaxID=1227546 RepID=A0A953HRE4_9BACT|nr:M1 family metallopeptidase [Membranihabitans marinus]MBY5956523.1 M1 family metallopeptidase [Membranihabitans marinus]